MCNTQPKTEKSLERPDQVVGLPCPICGEESQIGYMKFRDPHGVDRIDPELFECSSRKHSFTATTVGLRLLASEGQLSRENREFVFDEGALLGKQ